MVPKPEDLLSLKNEEILELLAIPVSKGVPVTEAGSTFTGYVADVETYQEVNAAYEQVRYNHMKCSHCDGNGNGK